MSEAPNPEVPPTSVLADRRAAWAFWSGCAVLTVGVCLHLPMYWMARGTGFRLAGTPMDTGMLVGMALIVGGLGLAAYGLLPQRLSAVLESQPRIAIAPPDEARLGPAHVMLMVVLTLALVIDVMKPASLGFVVPGMIGEYKVAKATVAWLPLSALTGTVVGSLVWGWLADLYGRRAAMVLSAVMFVGTSICGAMPSLWWNVAMCFLMGAAAGGMLPVTYALMTETMPARHRGWCLVLIGGLGGIGGYLAASVASALLQPYFGWRILWFLNLPTGLLLIAFGGFIPESARFLLAQGRIHEARVIIERFGSRLRFAAEESVLPLPQSPASTPRRYAAKTLALSVAALGWSLVNFGILLWLPNDLVAHGYSMAVSSRLLAQSALIAAPAVGLSALLYSRWSTKWSLVAMIAITTVGLALVVPLAAFRAGESPLLPIALLIIGSNGVLAILLPYTAESYPMRVRGRASGWVAACSKGGGIASQLLGIASAIPPLAIAAIAVAVANLAALGLVAIAGDETRGRDLEELE